MDRGFAACEKPRPDPRAGGAQGHRRGKPAPICDAAGSEDRDWRDAVDNHRNERYGGDGIVDMAAGLPSLRNDRVGAVVDRDSRCLGVRHRVQHFGPAVVRRFNQRTCLTPKERDDWHAFGKANS